MFINNFFNLRYDMLCVTWKSCDFQFLFPYWFLANDWIGSVD